MRGVVYILISFIFLQLFQLPANATEREISEAELHDKLMAFWLGQLVGNYMGLPFENRYVDEPVPLLIDRYYTHKDDTSLILNRNDWRGYIPLFIDACWGAMADDDTDIEFVTLHAVEKYGLDITYPEITQMWKKHINRKIWVANRTARDLMDKGFVAPETGLMENNKNWFQIDPQLVNEIWSVFYPGMTQKAAERALWGARITNDSWGTHPTIAYGIMISAAFFEKDTEKLVQMAIEGIPNEGPFAEGMRDVVRWHKQYDDWRITRQKIHEKYYRYENDEYKAPISVVSSLNNGLCGVMAILYGEGDFMKTVGIAVSAGYDCDNQAATVGGLMGVINGTSCIPDKLTKEISYYENWEKPFNDQYINFSRDNLPTATPISNIVERIANISKTAIRQNGGRMVLDKGNTSPVTDKTILSSYKGVSYTWQFGENAKATVSGGDLDDNTPAEFVQDGERVRVHILCDSTKSFYQKGLEGFFDGNSIEFVREIEPDIFWDDLYGNITYIINCDF